mgnify:CR=1 FL=1
MIKKTILLPLALAAISLSACGRQPSSDEASALPLADNGGQTAVSSNTIQNGISSKGNAPSLIADDSVQINSGAPVNQETSVNKNNTMSVATVSEPRSQKNLLGEYSRAIFKTNKGNIEVKLYSQESPVTVNNFLNLAAAGFYDGVKFHRVIKDFMIQGGDPLSKGDDVSLWGTGGPGYRFTDEINDHKLLRGSLAMANAGANTNGSQFFIVTAEETPWLDGKHTNFGEVISGLDVVTAIESAETGMNDRPIEDIVINSIELEK